MLRSYTERQYQAGIQAAVAAAVAPLRARIAELEQELARLKKNSSKSSKPPSSDIVKPPKITVTRKKGKRHKGDQPGPPGTNEPPFRRKKSTGKSSTNARTSTLASGSHWTNGRLCRRSS